MSTAERVRPLRAGAVRITQNLLAAAPIAATAMKVSDTSYVWDEVASCSRRDRPSSTVRMATCGNNDGVHVRLIVQLGLLPSAPPQRLRARSFRSRGWRRDNLHAIVRNRVNQRIFTELAAASYGDLKQAYLHLMPRLRRPRAAGK